VDTSHIDNCRLFVTHAPMHAAPIGRLDTECAWDLCISGGAASRTALRAHAVGLAGSSAGPAGVTIKLSGVHRLHCICSPSVRLRGLKYVLCRVSCVDRCTSHILAKHHAVPTDRTISVGSALTGVRWQCDLG
jgi:hypothetical protein